MGGHDPGTLALPPAHAARLAGTGGPPHGPAGRPGWTTARIISVVAGALAGLVSLGLLWAGGTALWAQTQRHGGYVDLGTASYATSGYAIASDALQMHMAGGGWDGASALVGTVRIQVTPAAGSGPAFIGIAPAVAAQHYLSGVSYATVRGIQNHHGTYTEHAGSAPAARGPRLASGFSWASTCCAAVGRRWGPANLCTHRLRRAALILAQRMNLSRGMRTPRNRSTSGSTSWSASRSGLR